MSLTGYRIKLFVQGGLTVYFLGYVLWWAAYFLYFRIADVLDLDTRNGAFAGVHGPGDVVELQFLLWILALWLVLGLLCLRATLNTRRFIRERFTPDSLKAE